VAEITARRTGEVLRVLFEILWKAPEGVQASEALARLTTQVALTPYEAGEYESGGRRFEKIVRFATVDCVKAGWLMKSKGRWSLTEEGRSAYNQFKDPEAFYKEARQLYQKWQKSQPEEVSGEEPEEATAKAVTITFEQAQEQAWGEIENHLHNMSPYDFQDLVAALLRALGYYVAWVSPPGKDGGVDILAWPDPLGTKPPRIKVQVKRYVSAVNVDGLRSFMALLGEDDVGIFVAAGGFTKDARDEARTQEKRKVTLIDLERLFDLWVEHYVKLPEEDRRRLPLQPIHFLAPAS
jgi:restriction system protein